MHEASSETASRTLASDAHESLDGTEKVGDPPAGGFSMRRAAARPPLLRSEACEEA